MVPKELTREVCNSRFVCSVLTCQVRNSFRHLAISSTVYEALTHREKPQQALAEMAGQLTQIIRDG